MQKLPDLPLAAPVIERDNRLSRPWAYFLRELVVRAGGAESRTLADVAGQQGDSAADLAALEAAVLVVQQALAGLAAVTYLVTQAHAAVPQAQVVSAAGLALLDDADAAAQRATLGLVPGADVQPYDADLSAIAALAGTSGLLRKTGANAWSLETTAYVDAEQAQDAVGGILTDSSTIDLTYNDSAPSISAAAITQMSLSSDASGLKLVNDAAAPGVSRYYGTDSGGTKGWFFLTETIQDAIGTILQDSTTIDLTYDDNAPDIRAAVITQQSLTSDASGVKLAGDVATPGHSQGYGTNDAGTRGWYASPRLLFTNTTVPGTNTVSNTVAETAIGSVYTVPANSLTAGRVLRVHVAGVYSVGGATPTLQCRLRWGGVAGVLLLTTGAFTTTAGLSNAGFWLEARLTVVTVGASGTLECQGYASFAVTATTVVPIHLVNTAPLTVDTTTAKDLTVTWQWSLASTNHSVRVRQYQVEVS